MISASVPPLVSDDVWNAAIATLKRNRAMPRNSCHAYLLRSLIRCAVCGLAFCGTWARTAPRYRCNGSMAQRGPFPGKCIGASIKGETPGDTVWSDVSRFLSDPEDLIDELLAESSDQRAQAVAEAERASHSSPLAPQPKTAASAPSTSTPAASSPRDEFDAIAAEVERELNRLDERLAALEPPRTILDDAVAPRTCSRDPKPAGRRTSQAPSGRRSFSCSCAGSPSTRPCPTAAASRSASLSTTASRE